MFAHNCSEKLEAAARCVCLNERRRKNLVSQSMCQERDKRRVAVTLSSLPDDVIHGIVTFLPFHSLLSLNATSRFCHHATNHRSLWLPRFNALASVKSHIPIHIRNVALYDPKRAIRMAYQDRYRQWLTRSELVGTSWYFFFKDAAGEDWTSWDPYHKTNGQVCRKLVFLADGTVMQEAVKSPMGGKNGKNREEQVSSFTLKANPRDQSNKRVHENSRIVAGIDSACRADERRAPKRPRLSCGPSVHHSDSPQLQVATGRQLHKRLNLVSVFSDEPLIPKVKMTWRFITQPVGFPRHDHVGGYVRLTVGGREVPTYIVRRITNGNWGFVMESCWSTFASFDVTKRNKEEAEKAMEEGVGGSRIPCTSSEIDSNLEQGWCHATMTTEYQWREAMLYNAGITALPEVT